MRQVNWPSRLDVWSTTIVVIVTVAFFGVYFWLTDLVFSRLYMRGEWIFQGNSEMNDVMSQSSGTSSTPTRALRRR